jgi:hypothetical protein
VDTKGKEEDEDRRVSQKDEARWCKGVEAYERV